MSIDTTHTQKLIQAVIQADAPERLISAVRALADARLEAGITTLIAALGYNNPGAAAIAMNGLIAMGTTAVVPLLENIDGYNYGARAYNLRALAAIADPRALDRLLQAAENDFAPSVRRAAAKGLGKLHWQQLPAAEISAAQAQAASALQKITQDPDWSIRYAAIVGLQALGAQPEIRPQIRSHLQQMVQSETDPAVLARAQLACQMAFN